MLIGTPGPADRLLQAARLRPAQRRDAGHRRGRPDVRHGVHRRPALPPAAAARAERRQSMLFSATLSFDVMELAYVFMNDAVRVSVTPGAGDRRERRAPRLPREQGREAAHAGRRAAAQHEGRVLVFVNMRRSADRVSALAQANGIQAPPPSPATSTSAAGCASSPTSRRDACPCWWRPTSPRAGCTSRASPTSSTTTCRSTPRTTCTASGGLRARAPRGTRSASPARTTSRGWRPSRATSASSYRTRSREDHLLVHPLHHPPREHRESRAPDRRRHDRDRGPGREHRARPAPPAARSEPRHAPAHPEPRHAGTAEKPASAQEPRRRRRRRRRKPAPSS